MSPNSEAARLLKGTVQRLKDIMQKAVHAGEFRDLQTLAHAAQAVTGLAEQLEMAPGRVGSMAPVSPSLGSKSRSGVEKAPSASNRPNAGYPKFQRDGDKLVKIGWSKSQRTEYQHRAPKLVACMLVGSMSRLDKRQFPVPVEKLLPLTDPRDNTEIPTHQVYLALGWLRAEGIVQQHGRDGYSLAVKGETSMIVERCWAALPSS